MDTVDQPDRKRRKQAEFLVHRFLGWNLISGIRVCSDTARARVEDILGRYPKEMARPVRVSERWYY